jgi:hypothetical protein
MLLGTGNRFNWWASNATAPVAAATLFGTTLTSGAANTVGSTAQLLASGSVTEDVYGVLLHINGNQGTGINRSALLNLRVDPAGGTSWTTIIANIWAGFAGYHGNSSAGFAGGTWYWFPLFIKAGSSIGANIQNATATVTAGVAITVFGKPSRPEMVYAGSYCTTFGADTANSRGTTMTPGNTGAEGAAWVQLGSNTTKPHSYWVLGPGVADNTATSHTSFFDLAAGDGSNKDIIIADQMWQISGQEACVQPAYAFNNYREVATGTGIYVRSSTGLVTPDSNHCAIAYGIGG